MVVIPARSGSKGLPGKNLREIAGMPLVAFPILAAKKSRYVDFVFCSTDSPQIASIAREHGADTSYIRPISLAQDTTPSVDVVLDVIFHFESVKSNFDFVVMLEPTSPLTDSDDVDKAIERLIFSNPRFDSLITVSQSTVGHPHFTFSVMPDGKVLPVSPGKWSFKRRQDLEPLFFQTGTLYISNVQALKRNCSFICDKTLGHEVPKLKSFEIDDLIDFRIVELLITEKKNFELNLVNDA